MRLLSILARTNVEKIGKEYSDRYTFEDCLEDWMVVNWAWEVKE